MQEGRIARCIFNGQAMNDYLKDANWLTFRVKDGIVYFRPCLQPGNNAIELDPLPDGRKTIDLTTRLLGGHLADILSVANASYMLLHQAARGWIRLEYFQGVRPKVPCCKVYPLNPQPKPVIINPVQHVTSAHRVVLDAFTKVHEYEIENRLARKRKPREILQAARILSTFQFTINQLDALKRERKSGSLQSE